MKTIQFLVSVIFLMASVLSCNSEKPSGIKDNPEKKEPAVSPASAGANSSNPMLEENLRKAAMEGNITSVQYLISKNVNVNAPDPDGRTAMMLAAFNGHTDIVKALIDRGSPVNKTDQAGRTALIYAATGPFAETAKLLLSHKADPNIVDTEERFTALMFAASEGHLEVVKVLITNKANPLLKDKDNDDAEAFARRNGHNEVADFLRKSMNSLK